MDKGGPKIKESPADKAQAAYLQNLEATVGQPIRNTIMPQALRTLGGPGVFDTTLPAADRQVIEDQFKQAQKNTMNTGVRGGQLYSQMAQNNRDRATAVAGATTQAKNQGIERSLGLVPTAFPTATAQLGAQQGIGGHQTTRNLTQAQLDAQAQQQKGQSMGGLLGMFSGKS